MVFRFCRGNQRENDEFPKRELVSGSGKGRMDGFQRGNSGLPVLLEERAFCFAGRSVSSSGKGGRVSEEGVSFRLR